MVKDINRVVTGAHYGLRDWLIQRITAVLMVVYIVLWVFLIAFYQVSDQAALKSLLANQWMRIASVLFFISLCWHAWVGLRNVVMDYIHASSMRLTIHIVVILSLFFYLIWFIEILWG